jgi:hypothetical protein
VSDGQEYMETDQQLSCRMIQLRVGAPTGAPPPKPPRVNLPITPSGDIVRAPPDIVPGPSSGFEYDPRRYAAPLGKRIKKRQLNPQKICCITSSQSKSSSEDGTECGFKYVDRGKKRPSVTRRNATKARSDKSTRWSYEKQAPKSNFILFTSKKTVLPAQRTIQMELTWPDCPIPAGSYEFQVIQAYKQYKNLQSPNAYLETPADGNFQKATVSVLVHNPGDEDIVLGSHVPFGYAKAK